MEWIPYPQNLPERDGEYLISFGHYVTIAEFQENTKLYNESGEKYCGPVWHDLREGGMHNGVKAFMEKPKGYGV